MTASPSDATLSGTTLVEASAGTGKTHAITTLFVRLLLEQRLTVSEIVVVTFTEAATAELRARIRRRLRETVAALDDPSGDHDDDLRALVERVDRDDARRTITRAIAELDLAAVSTIHAFCLRALQEHAFESGAPFGLELAADTSDLVREVAEDYWSTWMVPMAPDLYRLVSKALDLSLTEHLVRAIVRRPSDIPILPTIIPPHPELLRPSLESAHAVASATWVSSGERICKVLADAKLSQAQNGGYTAENLGAWRAALDEHFAIEPRFSSIPALVAMSKTRIAERTRRNGTPPWHKFFEQADKLVWLAQVAERDLVLKYKLDLPGLLCDVSLRRKRPRYARSSHSRTCFILARRLRPSQGAAAERLPPPLPPMCEPMSRRVAAAPFVRRTSLCERRRGLASDRHASVRKETSPSRVLNDKIGFAVVVGVV